MKYEDLNQMYWDINNAITDLSLCDLPNDGETIERLNWCLATINEELRELEITD